MDNDFKFTWSKMSLCFPEWKKDMPKKEFDYHFPQSPDFSGEQISFAYKKEYGIQMFLNQTIPSWIKKTSEKECAILEKIHSELSHKLYDETLKDLDSSFEVLEGWRKFITKHNGIEREGNLQNHIEFNTEGNTITLWDYFKFYLNPDSKNNSPTDILYKIGKLPEDSLNEKWKKYFELAEKIEQREGKGSANKIIGKNLTECIANADEIYKLASELKELKF